MNEVSRIDELRRALTRADPAAFLVEPRVIRRASRELHGFARLATSIPHADSQIISARNIRVLMHPDELGLPTFDDLPPVCLLIGLPEEVELQHWPMQELQQLIWRRLFHGQIDRRLAELTKTTLTRAEVQKRIAAIGQVEFDEAHFVLKSEHRLTDVESRISAYCEFVAVRLELQRFAPDLLATWFPSLAGRADIDSVIGRDIDADAVFHASRLYGAPPPDVTPRVAQDEARLSSTRSHWFSGTGANPSDRGYVRLLRRRERAHERGNTVAAVVCAMRAAERATSDEKRESAREKARADVASLVERLRHALNFPASDMRDWNASLWELATNSIHDFWNADKRLLFDLQKVCLDHERVTYKVDLVKWIVSRGQRPFRRPLNSVREVMMAKHLARSAARLVSVRLSGFERERLDGLLHDAAHLAERQMRERMRPALRQTLHEVGLNPDGIPERAALDKLVEDSLDCIAQRGYLNMGYLRDSISRNDLKIPDLKHPIELIRGDHLLRSDDRLDIALDGVYRRGEFYLRWLQITSSLFFGTRLGRFFTLFLIIPFGGAVIIVEGMIHLSHKISGSGATQRPVDTPGSSHPTPHALTSSAAADSEALAPAPEVSAASAPTRASAEPGTSSQPAAARDSGTGPDGVTARDPGIPAEQTSGIPEPAGATIRAAAVTSEIAGVPQPVPEVVAHQVPSLTLVLLVGFFLMGLIHAAGFRRTVQRLLRSLWRILRSVVIDLPVRIVRLRVVQLLWRNRALVRLRRLVISPGLLAFLGCRVLPAAFVGYPLDWWWVAAVGVLLSIALDSRLGRDTEELTAEWLSNLWHDLRARVVVAVIEWILDFFKTLLGLLERLLYAGDEWLRFHSGESWLTLILKACLGVVWSLAVFVIRIYVNLLIEPTFNPVKHFPVVTVAHKIFLPILLVLESRMRDFLTPYTGQPLAVSVTWFNIFFLPGFFGFAVWELKENWRLYAANRHQLLRPVLVGSHGETIARLIRPGFHSGTLPKLFRRMRRLEQKASSFRRFTQRRAVRSQLEHVECAVQRFVERELIRLLQLCSVWHDFGLSCRSIQAASNSLSVRIECDRLSDQPLVILFQEQSGWVVATIADPGWLRFASGQQTRSLEHALIGFYRKSGVDLVREQLRQHLVGHHAYDIDLRGLTIWPDPDFRREITADLSRRTVIRPLPAAEAAAFGLVPTEKQLVVFSTSTTSWEGWLELWRSPDPGNSAGPPRACSARPAQTVLAMPLLP